MLRGKNCKPGDKVRLLHEKGEGVVIRNTAEFLYVDTGDGFELPVLHNDVIIIEKAPEKQELQSRNDDHIEQFQKTESPVHHKESVKKEIHKKGSEIVKGIYLAFAPVNQDVVLAGDISLYLINYTKISTFYVLYTNELNQSKPAYSGTIEAASALLIDTISRNDTAKFRNGVFQCLFTESTGRGVAAPFFSHLEIKPERFLKDDMYAFNSAISMYSLTTQLLRFDEIQWIQGAMGKDAFRKDQEVHHSRIIEKEGLIMKYTTAPGEAEVDLHIESFVENPQTIDDAMKLKKQLDLFRECYESAQENRYSKVVFIHGVGVGVLKIEIQKFLRTQENIQFRDAPIARYGIGATEVVFTHN